MGMTLSAEAKAVLERPVFRAEKRFEIHSDLLDGALHQTIDVTDYVKEWNSESSGDSTLTRTSWTKISMTPVLRIDESKYTLPGDPASLWTALGKKPTDCWIWVKLYVPLPSGVLEKFWQYIGKIIDAQETEDEVRGLELVTVHASEPELSVEIDKSTGDTEHYKGSTF